MSNQVFKCKWNEIEEYQSQLKEVSGLYYWYLTYNPQELLYVGETTDLLRRFKQYQKDKREGKNNQSILDLIEAEPDSIMIAFQPIDTHGLDKIEQKRHLKKEEAKFIQDWIPLFNIEENPRRLIHPIQKVIGQVVSKANREVTFNQMREYLFRKWKGNVSYEQIDEALANKQNHLSRYCKTSQKQKTLNLKDKKTA
ncbi:GIY-YIG nuclease family protein [Salipaludibacillus sp. CF4.18]|uniref:GIY-YIG nuclease family protein n=1 Tax=Salipaludibacillus sp. CF4.18 TaxID=3373081 RepID=UPI003EE6ED58